VRRRSASSTDRTTAVDGDRLLGGPRPREAGGPLAPGRPQPLGVVQRAQDRGGQVVLVARVEPGDRVAAHLRQRGGPRRRDRHAAGHRLEQDEAEALVERGVHEAGRAAHPRVERGVVEPARQHDARRAQRRGRVAQAGQDQLPAAQLALAQRRERLHEAAEVLFRADVPDGEEVRRPAGHRGVAERQRGAVVHDAHLRRVGPQAVDEVARGEARDGDDPLGAAHRRARERPVLQAGRAREVVAVHLEGEVVHRHDARARAHERQEAVRRVHDVRRRGTQAQRPADLLPGQLRQPPAAGRLAHPHVPARVQRREQIPSVAAPPAQLRGTRVAGVHGDGQHPAAR
jgi:hypothetical protein